VSQVRARAEIEARSAGFCEAAIPDVCLGTAQSAHHRRKRSQGGQWTSDNLIHVCGSGTTGCHGWIEAHPHLALERGLTLAHGEPMARPVELVFRGHRARWRLEDNGTLTWLFDR
jgi:hypothetical protein